MQPDASPAPTFSYQPPPGGDVTLKSIDGVIFLGHSTLLTMASSVFANMISTANHSDVELSDDAVSVSLMLRFIYPPTFMEDLPRELLEKSLTIARKYDIAGIITSVDHLMYDPSNQGSPLKSDPVYAFCLASTYELPRTKKAAIEALRPERFGFTDAKEILPFVQTFPHASSAIGLLGAHCVRTRRLMELLLGDRRRSILPRGDYMRTPASELMICKKCVTSIIDDMHELEEIDEGPYETSWLEYWTMIAFHDLATRSLDQCQHLFSLSILDRIEGKPNVCRDCIQAARDAERGLTFILWAERAAGQVVKIFESIDELYTL